MKNKFYYSLIQAQLPRHSTNIYNNFNLNDVGEINHIYVEITIMIELIKNKLNIDL